MSREFLSFVFFFFFNDTATTEIYTLSLHDALPICLAATTRIATPDGAIPVSDLRAGMLVWTVDAGKRVAAPIAIVRHTPAPFGHRVIRIVLADGRAVVASPGHPTGDGRRVGELKSGDLLDGSRVVTMDVLPYTGDTWDL